MRQKSDLALLLLAIIVWAGSARIVHAQVGWTLAEARELFVLGDEQADAQFREPVGYQQWSARPLRGGDRGLILSSKGDRIVAARLKDPRALNTSQCVAFAQWIGRQPGDDKRRRPAKWQPATSFLSAFPPVGMTSARMLPVTRTIGQQRTVTINIKTGGVVGTTPWEDIKVPTGRLKVQRSGHAAIVDTIVSSDGRLIASFLIHEYLLKEHTSTVTELVVSDFEYSTLLCIDRLTKPRQYETYESSFNHYVPEALWGAARQRRLAAFLVGVVDYSNLEPVAWQRLEEKAMKFGPLVKPTLFELLAKRLIRQSRDIQKKRMPLIAKHGDKDALAHLVMMTRQPRDIGRQAETLIHDIARRLALAAPPKPGSTTTGYKAWLDGLK